MENCANEWNLILFDRYTPVNDKIGYGENRESDYLCILTIYNFLLRTMRRYANLLAVLALSTNLALHAQTNELVIQTKKLGAEIQPTATVILMQPMNRFTMRQSWLTQTSLSICFRTVMIHC